ncbi:septum formation initiator family protein [Streptomyces sp. NPDC053541]|uniref:septum formation initiator family protein n=1 Tax=Streptomyces sp. NPDC053541 TaxID=3365709 RepID=UPI0037CF49EB
MPSGTSTAARTPFVLLVVLLLGGGLITLLLLNSALNQGSFELSELKKRTTELTDEEQALQHDVDDSAAPDALERRARELGMVPGGTPAFLDPDGKVRGVPSVAVSPKPSPRPTPPAATTPPATPPAGGAAATRTPAQQGAAGTASPTPAPPATPTATGPTTPPPTATAPTTSGR